MGIMPFEHGDLEADSVNIHTPCRWVVADSAGLAAITPDPEDLYKMAWQIDIAGAFMLVDDSPVTWEQMSGYGITAIPGNHSHSDGVLGDGGVMTNDAHDGFSQYTEISTPSTPGPNEILLYPKDVAGATHMFVMNSTGTEVDLSAGGTPADASTTVKGIVELATTAETQTGTDATRAVTPDGLHDMTSLAGAGWFLDEDSMASDDATKTASQQSIKAYVDATVASGAPDASDTVKGKVELATTAETTTGTDATRAVTPDGLHDMTSLAGAAWFLDEDNMASDSATKTASQQSIKAYVDAAAGASSLDALSDVVITSAQNGQILRRQAGTFVNIYRYYPIDFLMDGAGTVISTGVKGTIRLHTPGVIVAAGLMADQSGNAVVDIWKDTFANYPPDDSDSITASTPLTLSGASSVEDTTLTSWVTTVADGDVLRFNLDSIGTITRLTVFLKIRET